MSNDNGEPSDNEAMVKATPEEKVEAVENGNNGDVEIEEESGDPLEAGPKNSDEEADEAGSDKNDDDYGAKSKKKPKKVKKKKSKGKVSPKKTAGRGRPKSGSKKSAKKAPVEEEYEVQDIVGHKEVRGNLLYKIRWKGYGPNGDTWEPLETLSCPDLLVKYNKKNKVSTGKRRGAPLKANRAKAAKYESSDEGLPSDDDEEYEVEKILNVNEKRNGKREFLVHWKGYSKGDAGWEPEENLSCQDLINSFMKTYEEKKNSQKTRVTKKATDRFSVKDNGRGRRSKRNSGKRTTYEDSD